ncbi:MAG: hypothetical protein WA294_12715 [Acidobacteriaceae bacterium]
MKPEKRFAVLLACIILAGILAACWFGVSRYRQTARCDEAKKAFILRVGQMTRDADKQLAMGRSRDDVAAYFQSNGIAMTVAAEGDHEEASGALKIPAPKGCAAASCFESAGRIRVVVELDPQGKVMVPGFVFATGTNCM